MAADSVASACAAALNAASPQDRIVVFGSFHTVGPALDWLDAQRIAAAVGASRIYFAVMDRRVKERLIGASILVALVGAGGAGIVVGPKTDVPRLRQLFRRRRPNRLAT